MSLIIIDVSKKEYALMAKNWQHELKGKERVLYEKVHEEMIKEKGNKFPEECTPLEVIIVVALALVVVLVAGTD